MEKKDHLIADLKRSLSERGELITKAEKVPETQKEVANLTFYDMVHNLQVKGA